MAEGGESEIESPSSRWPRRQQAPRQQESSGYKSGFERLDAEGGVRSQGQGEGDGRGRGGGGGGTEGPETNEVGGDVDLFARTWESLDFGVVLDRLSRECRTEMGQRRALVPDFKTNLEEVCFGETRSEKNRGLSFHHLVGS